MKAEAEKLLMMFIRDGYKNSTGRISKATAIEMMKYVNTQPKLQQAVSGSDYKAVLAFRAQEGE